MVRSSLTTKGSRLRGFSRFTKNFPYSGMEKPRYRMEFDPSCFVSVAAVIKWPNELQSCTSICNKNELRRKKRSYARFGNPMAPASRSRQDVDAWKLGSTVVGGGIAKEVVINKSKLLWFVHFWHVKWAGSNMFQLCGWILAGFSMFLTIHKFLRKVAGSMT